MALTANFYAGDTDKLWKTAGYPTPSGIPVEGDEVQQWQDEATPATRDIALIYKTSTANSPTWRADPFVMARPCVRFDGASDYCVAVANSTGAETPTLDTVFNNNAKTLIVAFRLENSCSNEAVTYRNTAIFNDSLGFSGIFLKTVAGVHSIYSYNWDGTADVTTSITVSLNTDYVYMLRHNGTTLFGSLLSGQLGVTRTDQSIASGNTTSLVNTVWIGRNYGNANYFPGCIGELYFDDSDLGSTNTPLTNICARWLPKPVAPVSRPALAIPHAFLVT